MHYEPAARAVCAITPTILQLLTIPRKDTGMAEYECFKVDVADFVATVRRLRELKTPGDVVDRLQSAVGQIDLGITMVRRIATTPLVNMPSSYRSQSAR